MLGEPAPTPGDVHFRVAGFPVRVHPLFWVIALVLGLNSWKGEPVGTLLSVVVVFVSILVHELGHAVMQRKYGGWPRIVLYGMGGLAICDDCDRSPRSQIIISFAGPAAGFLLAGLIVLLLRVSSSDTTVLPFWMEPTAAVQQLEDEGKLIPTDLLVATVWYPRFDSFVVNVVIYMLLWINVFWGFMNLLPIYPLDGGRIARELFMLGHRSASDGMVRSLQLSIGVAAVAAVLGMVWLQSLFTAILFGFLAYDSYRALQAYTGRGPGYGWG